MFDKKIYLHTCMHACMHLTLYILLSWFIFVILEAYYWFRNTGAIPEPGIILLMRKCFANYFQVNKATLKLPVELSSSLIYLFVKKIPSSAVKESEQLSFEGRHVKSCLVFNFHVFAIYLYTKLNACVACVLYSVLRCFNDSSPYMPSLPLRTHIPFGWNILTDK